jgi:hypothetical protein
MDRDKELPKALGIYHVINPDGTVRKAKSDEVKANAERLKYDLGYVCLPGSNPVCPPFTIKPHLMIF